MDPTAAAAALAPAFQRGAIAETADLLPPSLRAAGYSCEAIDDAAAPFLRFIARLHDTIMSPRQRRSLLQKHAPRVVIVGGGPAGLSAALVAHAAGSIVTVIEQRLTRSRPVWFDLEPPGDEVGGSTENSPPTSQALLQSWGFDEFASEEINATLRVVQDERGSRVRTVQCQALERFLEACARLVGVNVLVGTTFNGACAVDGSDAVVALVSESSPTDKGADAVNAASIPQAAGEPLVLPTCPPGTSPAGTLTPGGTPRLRNGLAFDLLIGADGSHSTVRSSLGLAHASRSSFTAANGHFARSMDTGISQVSLIVSFALDPATGRCPAPKRDPSTGFAVAPHEIAWEEAGVSSAWKRLYEPYCELQILFDASLGEELLTAYEAHREVHRREGELLGKRSGSSQATGNRGFNRREERGGGDEAAGADTALARALPLDLLLRVCNHLLEVPLADETALLAALRRPGGPGSPPDAALFRISIRRAEAAGRVLLTPPPAADGQGTSAKRSSGGALALLRGDALVTPHYRLGVGINHALETLSHWSHLLRDVWGRGGRAAFLHADLHDGDASGAAGAAGALLAAWEASTGADARQLADWQNRVIHLEARCGLLVQGGARVLVRDRASRALREAELSPSHLRSLKC